MINLLPPETRDNIAYARKNSILLKYVGIIILVIIGILFTALAGQFYINNSATSYTSQIKQSQEQLKIQKLEETQKRVESISGSMKLAVQVLSKQVLFSEMLKQIGSAIPEGAVLTGLSINQLQGGIDITAAATDYNTATQVQLNLQDPNNKIFEKADIVNTQCSSGSGSVNPNTGQSTETQLDAQYPCKITVRALFAKDNPFLFIKNTGGSQ